jgi:murein DD-endopeptidase MepM/ murein hydrolase activator NlpD
MKRIYGVILLFILTGCNNTQNIYDLATQSFVENYNSENYDSIFMAFSDEMKTALPLNDTINFFDNLQSQHGRIIEYELTEKVQTSYSYKMLFERNIFTVNISFDAQFYINGLYITIFEENNYPIADRNTTKLILPFYDEWMVFWGGDTKELNYHVENAAQKNAFDFVIMDNYGKTFINDGTVNEDYYAFGREVIAPCDGKIVLAVDGVKDNIPGKMNPYFATGNTVIMRTENNEYILFAHLKQNSLMAAEGQDVKRGDIIGLCGNSGNSSEAHLHLHIQNIEDINFATGMKSYFECIMVNGEEILDYSPIQNDRVRN